MYLDPPNTPKDDKNTKIMRKTQPFQGTWRVWIGVYIYDHICIHGKVQICPIPDKFSHAAIWE